MRDSVVVAGLLVLFAGYLAPAFGSPRQIVVISDLHFGVGKDPATGKWHAYEDFRWNDALVPFLQKVDADGNGKTDLILNGDSFELWQSLEEDCRHESEDSGCSETEALGRMGRVVGAHRDSLEALGAFARSGDNRLVLVPGNHDVALLFPSVARLALEAIGAPGRSRVETKGFWLSEDGLVYTEHGHQIGKDTNRWESWPEPFLVADGGRVLKRPWGEQFVQAFYNDFEGKYPIIDNISSEGEGVRYAIAAEGVGRAAADVGGFLKFFLFGVSWEQFRASLGEEGEPPDWDVARIRAGGERFFLDSLPTDHPFRAATEAALDRGQLASAFAELSDDDIRLVCDDRAIQARVGAAASESTVAECPRVGGSLGAISEAMFRERDEVLNEHLVDVCLGIEGCRTKPFAVFVESHTHLAREPFSPRPEGFDPTVVNTGAWQRVVSPDRLRAIQRELGLPDSDILPRLGPESLPECYSFVRIAPYPAGGPPVASLTYWNRRGGQWTMEPRCSGT